MALQFLTYKNLAGPVLINTAGHGFAKYIATINVNIAHYYCTLECMH